MVKQAVLFTNIEPCAPNGATIYLARVLRALVTNGWKVKIRGIVSCPADRREVSRWVSELQIPGIEYDVEYASAGSLAFLPHWLRVLLGSVGTLRSADAVLFRLFWFQPVALLAHICKKDARVIWLHDGIVEEITYRGASVKKHVLQRIALCMERFFSRWVDVHLPVSEGMLRYAHKQGVRGRTTHVVLPCVVDTERFQPPKQPREATGQLTIGFSGSLSKWHAFEEACSYIRFLQRSGYPVRLHVLTPAVDEAKRILTRVGVEGIVEVVPHQDVPRKMEEWHFAISPQRPGVVTEVCSPLKVAEALAMGLPVIIAPRVGDYSNILVENGVGMVVDPANPDAWPETLSTFGNLVAEYPAACVRARAVAVQRFSIHRLESVLAATMP